MVTGLLKRNCACLFVSFKLLPCWNISVCVYRLDISGQYLCN